MFRKFLFITLICVSVPAISHAQITINSPQGGEAIKTGQILPISWTGGSDKVKITVYRCYGATMTSSPGDGCYYYASWGSWDHQGDGRILVKDISNTGSYSWDTSDFPATVRYSYEIGIIDNSTSSVEVLSKPFTISPDYPKIGDFYVYPGGGGDFGTDLSRLLPSIDESKYIVQVVYQVSNTTKCVASGDWSGENKGGIESQRLYKDVGVLSDFKTNDKKIFNLVCENPLGSVTKTVSYMIIKRPGDTSSPDVVTTSYQSSSIPDITPRPPFPVAVQMYVAPVATPVVSTPNPVPEVIVRDVPKDISLSQTIDVPVDISHPISSPTLKTEKVIELSRDEVKQDVSSTSKIITVVNPKPKTFVSRVWDFMRSLFGI